MISSFRKVCCSFQALVAEIEKRLRKPSLNLQINNCFCIRLTFYLSLVQTQPKYLKYVNRKPIIFFTFLSYWNVSPSPKAAQFKSLVICKILRICTRQKIFAAFWTILFPVLTNSLTSGNAISSGPFAFKIVKASCFYKKQTHTTANVYESGCTSLLIF